jgi:hypothetical protein
MSDIVTRAILQDEMSSQLSKIKKAFEKTSKRVDETDKKTQKLESSMVSLRGIAKGLTGALAGIGLGALAKSFIGAVTEAENLEAQFKSILGGADNAKKRIKELSDFASKTPFQLVQVAQASKVLQTLGGTALATGDSLRMVGDASAVSGESFENLAIHVGRAYSGLKANRPIGESMARLQELGLVSGETRNRIEDLQKQAKGDEAWKVLQTELKKTKGGMEDLSKTTTGVVSTLKDNWKLLLVSLNDGDFLKVPLQRLNLFLETTKETIDHMNLMNELQNKKQFGDLKLLIALSEKHKRLKELGAKFDQDEYEKENRRKKAILSLAQEIGVSTNRLIELRRRSALAGAESMLAQKGWNEETKKGLDDIIKRNKKRLEQADKIKEKNKKTDKIDKPKDSNLVVETKSQLKSVEELEAEYWAKRRDTNSVQRALDLEMQKLTHQKKIEDSKQYIEERFNQNDQLIKDDEENKRRLAENEKYYTDLLKREADHRKAIRMGELNLAMALTSSLSTISSNALGTSRKNAKARKTIALGEAIINTGLGVTKALASSPPPLNFINAGIVGAQGGAQISTIASQKFAQGGIVKGESGVPNIGDKTLVRVNAGEGVFTRDQMKALGGMMGTNNISPTLVVNGNVDSSTVPKLNDSLQSFADRIISAIRGNELDLVNELNLVTQ